MDRIAYTVTATLPSEALAREYINWLRSGHLDAVIRAGAESGAIVRLDPPELPAPDGPVQVETRYVFATREDFDRYIRHTAPALRAEGLERFGPAKGVRFERRTGVVL